MAVETDIMNLLMAAAKAALPDYRIAWENVLFEPQPDERYVVADVVPVSTTPSSAGLGGYDRHRGFLQLMVVVPLNDGPLGATAMVDQIRAYFTRGRSFRENGTELAIETVERHASNKDKARVFYPVTIYYRTDVPNV